MLRNLCFSGSGEIARLHRVNREVLKQRSVPIRDGVDIGRQLGVEISTRLSANGIIDRDDITPSKSILNLDRLRDFLNHDGLIGANLTYRLKDVPDISTDVEIIAGRLMEKCRENYLLIPPTEMVQLIQDQYLKDLDASLFVDFIANMQKDAYQLFGSTFWLDPARNYMASVFESLNPALTAKIFSLFRFHAGQQTRIDSISLKTMDPQKAEEIVLNMMNSLSGRQNIISQIESQVLPGRIIPNIIRRIPNAKKSEQIGIIEMLYSVKMDPAILYDRNFDSFLGRIFPRDKKTEIEIAIQRLPESESVTSIGKSIRELN